MEGFHLLLGHMPREVGSQESSSQVWGEEVIHVRERLMKVMRD